MGNYSESGIGELKQLKLSGQLELYNLKDIRKAEDAKEANLNSKRNLHTLALCWGMIEWIDDKSLYENVEVRVEDADAVLKELWHKDVNNLGLQQSTSQHGCWSPSCLNIW